jgi:signal transduction histidine kinase
MQKLRDISIRKKLYFIVAAMAILILLELVTLWFSIHTLSSVRALVAAEGLWSKAQKDGVYQLVKFDRSFNEQDYRGFLQYMAVPMGDHKTRLELLKPDPDIRVAREGFLAGRIHPEDIDGMIRLLRRFHNIYYIRKAISIWAQGDTLIAKQMLLGEQFHAEIHSDHPSKEKLDSLFLQIDPLNLQLTRLEDNFSYTLGEGSRWLENIILSLLFIVALTVEVTGLTLSISITRAITRGLRAIISAAKKILKGDLSGRATVYSKDEIGQVAVAVNQMTEQLTISNEELSQFAHIASHDLQEPLRTVSNYAELLQKKYQGRIDDGADKYLESIQNATRRMQRLIRDILEYSTIGYDKKTNRIDCNLVVEEVLKDMKILIAETNATIEPGKLPLISGYNELRILFQNLITNAIKFRKKEIPLIVKILAADKGDHWLFTVSDNGIGIEKKYYDRIFVIFQRLHSNKEFAGTGIGLAQCKKIVELHKGRIYVDSEPGAGSSFYFTIPKMIGV